MREIDAVFIGRRTFETVLAFPRWPYAKKVFILSNTLKNLPESLHDKAALLSLQPRAMLATLARQGYSQLYFDGRQVIQTFLREDCIDRMILTTLPVLLGGGIPLFGKLAGDLRFAHIRTKSFPNGLVKGTYERKHL